MKTLIHPTVAWFSLAWVASVGGSYWLGLRMDERSWLPETSAPAPEIARAEAALTRSEGAAAEDLSGPWRTASSYGYRNLVFTPELGAELIRLTELAEADYIISYVGLDELTRSMGPEAVKDALLFLKEAGEIKIDEDGAAGHLSFRLGMLLGDEGVAFAREHGLDVANTALGWCQTDPAEALPWLADAYAQGQVEDLYWNEELFWEWAVGSAPEESLRIYLQRLEKGDPPVSWQITNEIARIGSRLGRWDLLEANTDRLLALGDKLPRNLASTLAQQRVRADPWQALAEAEASAEGQWRTVLRQQSLMALAQDAPEALLAHWLEGGAPDSFGRGEASLTASLGRNLPLETLRTTLNAEGMPPAVINGLTQNYLRRLSESAPLVVMRDEVADLTLPAAVRRTINATVGLAWLDRNPEEAKAHLFASMDIDPTIMQAVRSGRPDWEIRLLLKEAITHSSTNEAEQAAAEEFLNQGR